MPIRELQKLFLLDLCREHIDALRDLELERFENACFAPALAFVHDAAVLIQILLIVKVIVGFPLRLAPPIPSDRQVQAPLIHSRKKHRDHVVRAEWRVTSVAVPIILNVQIVNAQIVKEGSLLLVNKWTVLLVSPHHLAIHHLSFEYPELVEVWQAAVRNGVASVEVYRSDLGVLRYDEILLKLVIASLRHIGVFVEKVLRLEQPVEEKLSLEHIFRKRWRQVAFQFLNVVNSHPVQVAVIYQHAID